MSFDYLNAVLKITTLREHITKCKHLNVTTSIVGQQKNKSLHFISHQNNLFQ